MPKQFLLETVSVDPNDVTDETIANIRPLPKVISVGLLAKSKNTVNRVALLSVLDDATDEEIAAISAEVKKSGLAIFVPNKEEAAKKKAAAAAASETKNKKKGVTKKVSLAETAFTAKPTEQPKKVVPTRGGRGGAAVTQQASTAAAPSTSNNNNRQSSSNNSRGGRGGRNNNGGRGGGRGGRGGNMRNMMNRMPVHMQAMMTLAPPSELMYRGAPAPGSNNNNNQQQQQQQQQQQNNNQNSQMMMMNNMMNNMMMSGSMPQGPLPGQTFSSSNLPPTAFAHQYGSGPISAGAPMMLTGPPPRLWSADVHAVFIANVAPPVTNKQLSLSSGEEIVVVHIERGEDVAIMYVATEQQARSAVQKLNGSFLHDRTLNVSYGGRKVIPLPYPPSNEVQQAQQQQSSNKRQIKNSKHVDPTAAAVDAAASDDKKKAEEKK